MSTKKEQIMSKAIELLREHPEGVRYSQLVKSIKENLPELQINTIHGIVWNLDRTSRDEVYKAGRGLFRHTSFRDSQGQTELSRPTDTIMGLLIASPAEERFYQPFAVFLERDLSECTKAIALGGRHFGDKWGTPDVIGVEKYPRSLISAPTTIISAEIKTDTSASALITAFGQACAYQIFSHKVYLVVPKDIDAEDKARIESLCQIFGIGLILFDKTNAEVPGFVILVRALKHEPDLYYVNKYLSHARVEQLF